MADKIKTPPKNIAPREQVYRTLRGLNATPSGAVEYTSFHRMPGKIEGGTRIITYATEASPQNVTLMYNAKTLYSLTAAEHAEAVKPALAEYERVCNIKFRHLPADQSHTANIILFTTPDILTRDVPDTTKPKLSNNQYPTIKQEMAGFGTPSGEQRYIVLRRAELKQTLPHELGHTLGLADIEGGVDRNGSVMAREAGSMSLAYDFLAPYDIDALQRDEYYGPPKNRNPDRIFNAHGKGVTLYSEEPITFQMLGTKNSHNIQLPAISTGDAPLRDMLSYRLSLNTDIANVNLTGSPAPQRITGNALPNVLIGGNAENTLTSIGANDTLIGNKNLAKDTFILTPGSFKTTLVNLDPSRDEIQLPEATDKVALRQQSTRTEATAFDREGKMLASFFAELPPEQTALALAEKLRHHTTIAPTSETQLGALTPLTAQPASPAAPLKLER